jgi:hypothetical protein
MDWSQMPGQVTEVIDYLLAIDDGRGHRENEAPAGGNGPVPLGHGVVVQQLESSLVDRLIRASGKRGENMETTATMFTAAFAYSRVATREEIRQKLYGGWDPTGALFNTMWLSRLVRDNATSTEFAVRRIIIRDRDERLVPFDAYDSHVAYKFDPSQRDWLTDEEVLQVAPLVAALKAAPPGDRVGRALRYSEQATRERFLEDAQPLIVRGLEALLKVGRRRLQQQFSQRVTQLAENLGLEVDEGRCAQAYDDRSALVHGAHVDLKMSNRHDEFTQTMTALQQILRAATRRAILDTEFAAIFASDAKIVETWPATHSETF